MSPSRGLIRLTPPLHQLLTHPPTTPQIFRSLSHNPTFNLALEHHLFTTLPPTTPHLLLYRNTPSIIIGRNQNPWVETAHHLLLTQSTIQLLRRRSGGGTVYHDLGNINYHVSVPTASFDRDTHAKMVVRALRRIGIPHAVVNKRHDIVITPTSSTPPPAEVEKLEEETPEGTRKVSGSAYKLTRLRSYHHGTMLLDTDLRNVRTMLKSPIKDITRARGVASVPSPVENVGVPVKEFVDAVMDEFCVLYGDGAREMGVAEVAEEEAMEIPEVRKGVEELRSVEWVYGQTPRCIKETSIHVPQLKYDANIYDEH
ncbi:hypothetical protein EX30DRAFT_357774 [Ascodesmis nigricans]|uniref:Putative lipoate-protein ligase A n=1 Tax=Ascodesmis nigricans TaxID=341454 RepID=A0A4S2N4P4_9PEZI|nr:hypothetical protein EX30DRAFT_357774 [Ascodesmis nigricans]